MGRLIHDKQLAKIRKMGQQAKISTIFGVAPDGKPWSEFCSQYAEDTVEWDKNLTDKEIDKTVKLYKGAHGGDREAQEELQTLRIEQTTNYLIPALYFGRYFEIGTLADNESAAVQNTTKLEFNAAYIGQDGGRERRKAVPLYTETVIDLFKIATDEVEYPLMDIYRGRIAESAKKTFDLTFDLENKIDANLYTLLTGALGNFTTTGKRSSRTFVPNSRIRAAILPTTNDINAFGVLSGTTLFGQTSLDAIVNYCALWPKDAEGSLYPTGEILVPADSIKDSGNGITITNAAQNAIAQKIADTGWYGYHYNGIDWKFIPEHTIPAKKCLPQLNRPVGKLWFKPGMAQDVEEVNQRQNVGTRWMSKVLAMTVLEPNKRNLLRVTYQT